LSGSYRPVNPLGKFLGIQFRAPSIASAPARFMAAVNLTGLAFFGADWGETQNEARPGLFGG
jgi:hypothetical protein